MGEQIGSGLTKSRKLSVLLSVCFAMGVLITVAEPDLSVLSNQIAEKIPPLGTYSCRWRRRGSVFAVGRA